MVKTIYKVILGSILIIISSYMIVEYINALTAGGNLNQLLRLSVERACEYFGQETYKMDSGARGNAPDVIGDGAYVSGMFYNYGTAEDVFKSLYYDNAEFKSFAMTYGGYWKNLKEYITPTGDGSFYKDNLITPLNMGVTYLDKTSVERIAKWNFAKILTNGAEKENLTKDTQGVYVNFSGYRVYPETLTVTNIHYEVMDLSDSRFTDITYMDGNVLKSRMNPGSFSDDTALERTNIMIAAIEFDVKVAYHGITPLQKMIEFMYDRTPGDANSEGVRGVTDSNFRNTVNKVDYDKTTSYTSGGLTSSSNTRAVSGKLVFYVIR